MQKSKTIEEKYQKMTQSQHILEIPDTYIGDPNKTDINMWTFDDATDRIIKKDIAISKGLFKLVDEIISNSQDHATELKMDDNELHKVTEIRVNIDVENGSITVYNSGEGIPIVMHQEHQVYIPHLLFGHLLTSTSYDSTDRRYKCSRNGYGVKLVNLFSNMMQITTVDSKRKKKYTQIFRNNMSIVEDAVITKCSKKPFTEVIFYPELSRFNMTEFDDDFISLIKRRTYDVAALTHESVSVYFNNVKLSVNTFEKYVNYYIGKPSETPRVYEQISDKWEIVVCSSPDNKMEHVTFVNGTFTYKGGKHLDYVANKISKSLVSLVSSKKSKNKVDIKQVHLKDNMWLFIKSMIPNPSFDSQTKETLISIASTFSSTCNFSDKFIENIYKKTDIVTKAISLCNFKQCTNMTKTDGKKKNSIRNLPKLDDANWAGTKKSDQCTIILTEGDSAKAFAIAGLSIIGRDRFGVFPLKGKLLNVRDITDKRVCENEEINNLKKIIGLQQYNPGTKKAKTYTSVDELRYGSILILTDQDVDGSHIKGLLINLFHYYWPSLLGLDGFIKSMATPIVKLTKSSQVHSFYTLTDYDNWKNENNASGWAVKYYKGLGTSTSKEAKEYFREFEQSKVQYDYSDEDNSAVNLAFNKALTDQRKAWLGGYDKNMILDQSEKNISVTDFVNKDLIHFSNYDNQRSIPSLCDGLKPSQRKVLYGVLLKNVKVDLKVSQLTGYISEKSCYHHGEMSLQGTIISMAHNFVGSNNIELLVPSGQFGSRLKGGKDSASPRYIFTRKSLITDIIYQATDFVLLNQLNDDGMMIEPEWYLPILPMILVNGAEGIGTGFSTKIPCYNPEKIVQNLRLLMEDKKMKKMTPYYRGFTGDIYLKDGKYFSRGVYTKTSETTVEITELPVGEWTDDYKEFLEKLIVDKSAVAKLQKEQCILNYESHYTEYNVKFILKFNRDVLEDMLDEPELFEKKFKLVNSKNVGSTNMHLYNRNGVIRKYSSAENILYEFYGIRLEFYVSRRVNLLEKLDGELSILHEKIRFIKGVVADEIVIFRKEDDEITETLEENDFMKIDDKFDYLINMSLRSLTKRKIEELEKQRDNKQDEYNVIESKTPKDLWTDDLDAFMVSYDRMMIDYNREYAPSALGITKKIKVKKSKTLLI
jgi:DNA topoisomerase-2